MSERLGLVTMKGKALTLVGDEPAIGRKAPNFVAVDNSLTEVDLSAYRGKTCILSSVPSLDTPVCATETRKFNEEASRLGADVVIVTISMDLPFAQKRWCGAEGISRIQTLSDHRDASFGLSYGVLIKELRLLARAVHIVDGKGVLRYRQLVPEVASEPDYEAVWKELNKRT